MPLWTRIYTAGENYSKKEIKKLKQQIVPRVQQSLMEKKRSQKSLSETSALGWDPCTRFMSLSSPRAKRLNQTQLNEHTRGRLPRGWAKKTHVRALRLCVLESKPILDGLHSPEVRSPELTDGCLPWWAWHGVLGRGLPQLSVSASCMGQHSLSSDSQMSHMRIPRLISDILNQICERLGGLVLAQVILLEQDGEHIAWRLPPEL